MAKIVITSTLPGTLDKYKRIFGKRVKDSTDNMILVKKVTANEKAKLSTDQNIQIFRKRGAILPRQSDIAKEKEMSVMEKDRLIIKRREREGREEADELCRIATNRGIDPYLLWLISHE